LTGIPLPAKASALRSSLAVPARRCSSTPRAAAGYGRQADRQAALAAIRMLFDWPVVRSWPTEERKQVD
jgi:hypothetical protein